MPQINSPGDIQVRSLLCRLVKKEELAHDVMALYFKLPDTEHLDFLAGQYIDIMLRDGRRRAFSLANSPLGDECLELHIRNVPDGQFSSYVFSHMREKTLLRIRGPLGSFYLRKRSERPAIFVAGGTGFAPIKSIIQQAIAEGITRTMYLYCGVRSVRDLYMDTRATSWAAEHAHLHYIPVLSEPLPEDDWNGRTGLVHEAVLEDFPDLSDYEVYSSGPPVMVDAARAAFPAKGLDYGRFFSDAFEHAYETGHDR